MIDYVVASHATFDLIIFTLLALLRVVDGLGEPLVGDGRGQRHAHVAVGGTVAAVSGKEMTHIAIFSIL